MSDNRSIIMEEAYTDWATRENRGIWSGRTDIARRYAALNMDDYKRTMEGIEQDWDRIQGILEDVRSRHPDVYDAHKGPIEEAYRRRVVVARRFLENAERQIAFLDSHGFDASDLKKMLEDLERVSSVI